MTKALPPIRCTSRCSEGFVTWRRDWPKTCGGHAEARFDNSPYFKQLPATAQEFLALVERDPLELPGLLGEFYPTALQLARFLETDDDARLEDPDAALDPNTRGLLIDTVRTMAPWARDFPTVASWDDEADRFLVKAASFRPARVATLARRQGVIAASDAERLIRSAELAAEQNGLGRRIDARAVAEAENLILALAGVTAAALAGALPVARAELARRSGATLADAVDDVRAFAETQQPDLRQALIALVDEGRRLEETGPTIAPATLAEPVPEDVEEKAQEMILRGEAPPVHWHRSIHRLYLDGTEFSNLQLLDGLTRLRELNLDSTQVKNLSALTGLRNLEELSLGDTSVRDVSDVAGLSRLRMLNLTDTHIMDISGLGSLTRLRHLFLAGTRISNLSALSSFTQLQTLFLSSTRVADISILSRLTRLEELDLDDTQISDVSVLANLAKLRELNLAQTRVRDISALTKLRKLSDLNLAGTLVSDLSPLTEMTTLDNLGLDDMSINDITFLERLTNLTFLSLDRTQVHDLKPLISLKSLQLISLSGTPVYDISPLSALSNLRNIFLHSTQVKDVSPLAALSGLECLYLDDTTSIDVSVLAQIRGLKIITK